VCVLVCVCACVSAWRACVRAFARARASASVDYLFVIKTRLFLLPPSLAELHHFLSRRTDVDDDDDDDDEIFIGSFNGLKGFKIR
jgi:hypothetical protein